MTEYMADQDEITIIEDDSYMMGIAINGEVAIEPTYDDINGFRPHGVLCKRAIVKLDGKYGIIDRDLNLTVAMVYDYISYFGSPCLLAKKDGKYGYIDVDGNILIPIKFENARSFYGDLAVVSVDGRWGCIDTGGELVVEPKYDEIEYFDSNDNSIRVVLNSKVGLIDKSGKEITPIKYDWIVNSYQFGYKTVKRSCRYGCVSESTGVEVIPARYQKIGQVGISPLVAVKIKGKWGYIDIESGTTAIAHVYEWAGDYWLHVAMVKKDGKFGVINTKGEPITGFIYDDAGDFYNGLAKVKRHGKWTFIDVKGAKITNFKYEDVKGFARGKLAAVKYRGKWGYINKEGKCVTPYKFDMADIFTSEGGDVKLNGVEGVVDSNGKVKWSK